MRGNVELQRALFQLGRALWFRQWHTPDLVLLFSALGPFRFMQDLWDCFFLSRDTLTEVPCVWEDLRVLTVLGSSCPLSGFNPVHYANSMVGAWMYWECAGCDLNFLGTAAPLWTPVGCLYRWTVLVSLFTLSWCVQVCVDLQCFLYIWTSEPRLV